MRLTCLKRAILPITRTDSCFLQVLLGSSEVVITSCCMFKWFWAENLDCVRKKRWPGWKRIKFLYYKRQYANFILMKENEELSISRSYCNYRLNPMVWKWCCCPTAQSMCPVQFTLLTTRCQAGDRHVFTIHCIMNVILTKDNPDFECQRFTDNKLWFRLF